MHISYLMEGIREAAREAAREEIRSADSQGDTSEPMELRSAPSLAEQLNELLMAIPCGMRLTVSIEQGPSDEEVGE